jgi:predicted transposase/invertase (TIGR01784 family)
MRHRSFRYSPLAKSVPICDNAFRRGGHVMKSRYINPYTDFGFKKLFGEEANKDLLIDFLNSILPERDQIVELEFQSPERLPRSPEDRRAVFDILCKNQLEEPFIVEMQKAPQHYFRDRAVFYSTFLIGEQAPKGVWDYALKPVYFVAILNFVFDTGDDQQKFDRVVKLKDQDGDVFYEKLSYHFYQMPLFTKPVSALLTQQDKWFYFLRNLESFDDIPSILCEPVFERAFATAEESRLSVVERAAYERDLKTLRDNYSVLKTASDTGYAMGHADGKAEGHADGHAEGKAEGKAEGEAKKQIEIARSLKQDGLAIARIAKATGLSESDIELL